MRSARTLFASAAVTAVIAVSAPAAYAMTSADGWDKDSGSSSSSSNGNNDDREKPDSWKHEKPNGGMDTGGGALAAVTADDWEKDKEKDKEESGSSNGNNDDREKPDSWKHEKPNGGMDTGGGALAAVTADDWEKDKEKDKEESGSSNGNNDDREKPDSWKHEKPNGGMDTGGGALAAVTADDWEKDKDKEESGSSAGRDDDREKSESWKHEKPSGGVDTGGGAMALSGSSLAAGSVLMLGGLGAGMYRLRRRNTSGAAI